MANEMVMVYTIKAGDSTRWTYRYFRSARALVRFARSKQVIEVLEIKQAEEGLTAF